MRQLILVFIGGGLGTTFRFLVSQLISVKTGGFPWGTFASNLLGCFFIGLIMGWGLKLGNLKSDIVLFLSIGFCGGLTTFSSFAFENYIFVDEGRFTLALIYTLLSILCGFLFVYLGFRVYRIL